MASSQKSKTLTLNVDMETHPSEVYIFKLLQLLRIKKILYPEIYDKNIDIEDFKKIVNDMVDFISKDNEEAISHLDIILKLKYYN